MTPRILALRDAPGRQRTAGACTCDPRKQVAHVASTAVPFHSFPLIGGNGGNGTEPPEPISAGGLNSNIGTATRLVGTALAGSPMANIHSR